LRNLLPTSRKEKVLVGTIIGIIAWILIVGLYVANLLEPYELKTYDHLCRLNAERSPAPEEIILVVVDQGSLKAAQEQGIHWPWPRQMYAPIVDFCTLSGARAVAFDVLFTEPSAYGVEDDNLLADALKRNGHVFLPISLSREARSQPLWQQSLLERVTLRLDDLSRKPISPFNSSEPPIRVLTDSCLGLGNVSIPPSPDGTYRTLPLVFPCGGHWVPSLTMALFDHLSQSGPVTMKPSAGKPLTMTNDSLHLNETLIPLDGQGNFMLSFYGGSRDFGRFSAFNVIQSFLATQEGRESIYPTDAFRGKIVLIGFTALGLFDLKPTPISAITPGIAVHATLIANLLHKDFRVRLSPARSLLLAAALAVAVAITVVFVSIFWQLALIFLGYAVGLIFFIFFSFGHNLWINGVLTASTLTLSFAMTTSFSYATEGRQRRQIKQMFSRYMSDLLIHDLLKHPEKLRLGGERQVLTVFFSDLAGFTTLCEKLAPEEVVTLLNHYLTAMTNLILSSGGIIDKYEGDAIMAFWGAPVAQEDHAIRACLAALDNQSRIVELREEFSRMGLPPVQARIGINTGEMIIGNLGSSQRFDFTVIGDSVNLASRLEGAGKEYRTSIIISEETYRQAQNRVEVRELDLLQVKGKDQPIRIYELLTRKGEIGQTALRKLNLFAEGLSMYRNQQWKDATRVFEDVLTLDAHDGPAKTFLERCQHFHKNPPGLDWSGVHRLLIK
jgi:adenylate cyclase